MGLRSASTVLLSLLLASAASAGSTTTTTRTETSRLDWRERGLHLAIEASQGVVFVRHAAPAGHFGLHVGDRVLQVGTQPVRRIDDLTTALARSGHPSVAVTVLRDGRRLSVPVATGAWHGVLPPAPPAPPARPAPQR